MRGIFGSVKGNDPVAKYKTGKLQYIGGTLTMTPVIDRGGA